MFDITMRSGLSIEKTYSIPMKPNPYNIQELIVVIDSTPSMSWLMSLSLVFQNQEQAKQFKQGRFDQDWIVQDQNLRFDFLFNLANKRPCHLFNQIQKNILIEVYSLADWKQGQRVKVQSIRRTMELNTAPLLNQTENILSQESFIILDNIRDALLDYLDTGKRSNIQVFAKYFIPLNSVDNPIRNLIVTIEPSRAISHLISVELVFSTQDEAKRFKQENEFNKWVVQEETLQFLFLFKDGRPNFTFSKAQIKILEAIYLIADWSQCRLLSMETSQNKAYINTTLLPESRIIANHIRDALLDYMHKLQIRLDIGPFGFNFLTLTVDKNSKNLLPANFCLNESKDILEYKSQGIVDIIQAKDFLQNLKENGHITEILFNHYVNELSSVSVQSKIYMVFPSVNKKFTFYIIARTIQEFYQLQALLHGLYSRNVNNIRAQNFFGKIFENRITISGESQEELTSKIVKAVSIMKEKQFLAEEHVDIFYQLAGVKFDASNSAKRKRDDEVEAEVPAQSFMPTTNNNNNAIWSVSVVQSLHAQAPALKISKTEMGSVPSRQSTPRLPSTHAQLLRPSGLKEPRTVANIHSKQQNFVHPPAALSAKQVKQLQQRNPVFKTMQPNVVLTSRLPNQEQFSNLVERNRLFVNQMNTKSIKPNSAVTSPLSVNPQENNTNVNNKEWWASEGALMNFLPTFSHSNNAFGATNKKNDNDPDSGLTC